MRKQLYTQNRKKILYACLQTIFCILWAVPGHASSDSADFLRMNITAAGAGQAAGVAAGGGSDGLNWNPAGITGQVYPSVSVTHFTSFADTAYEQLEGLLPGWLAGDWGIKLFFAKTYDFFETGDFGETLDDINNFDSLLQVSYARTLGSDLAVGTSAKFFYSVLGEYSRQGGALDIGLRYNPMQGPLSFGVAGHNMGIMSAYDQSQESLPLIVLAGLELKFSPIQGQQIQLTADYNLPIDSVDEGFATFGLVYQPLEFIKLRGGYRLDQQALGNLSLGLGVKLFQIGMDYAFQPFDGLGNSHRFTMSYYFEPQKKQPEPEKVKLEPKFDKKYLRTKNLIKPRLMKGHYEFLTPKVNGDVKKWTFEVRDRKGKLIRKVINSKPQLKSFVWDGRDQQGRLAPKKVNYQFIIVADDKARKVTALPQAAPVLKLWFENGAKIEPEVEWHFYDQPILKKWILTIIDRKTGKSVRIIKGKEKLPEYVVWNGKNSKARVAATNRKYDYQLSLTYPDSRALKINEQIESVAAQVTGAAKGKQELLIYGILYDFNSSKLKPVMENKVLMAAKLLRKYKKAQAVCEGKADRTGGKVFNKNLSYRRSKDVSCLLKNQLGVNNSQVKIEAYGEEKLWSIANTEEAKKLNRRVDIKVVLPLTNH